MSEHRRQWEHILVHSLGATIMTLCDVTLLISLGESLIMGWFLPILGTRQQVMSIPSMSNPHE
jgi:hypothetical protein